MSSAHLWSPSRSRFYPRVLRPAYEAAGTWPHDATDVDDAVAAKFMAPPPHGYELGAAEGSPAWLQEEAPSAEQLAAQLRSQAQDALSATDHVVADWIEAAEAVPAEWRAYRKALRAIVAGTSSAAALPARPAAP